MDSSTDHLNVTIVVDWDVNQQNKQTKIYLSFDAALLRAVFGFCKQTNYITF